MPAFVALVALVASCRAPQGRGRHRPSAVPQEPYAEVVGRVESLAARSEGLVTVIRYGTSSAGRPLTLVRLGRGNISSSSRPAVLLTQAIHGDEYLGVVDRLPAELLREPRVYARFEGFMDRGGLVYFVPIVNPDGYEARRRANDRGRDLNRDFDVLRYVERLERARRGELDYSEAKIAEVAEYVASAKLTEPETRGLVRGLREELTRAGAKLKLAIDYHCCEDEHRSALIHEWGDTRTLLDGSIAEVDVKRYERAAALFAQELPGNLWGSGLETIDNMVVGSVDEWLYEAFADDGALTFCYEARAVREDENLRGHARFLDALVGEPELR